MTKITIDIAEVRLRYNMPDLQMSNNKPMSRFLCSSVLPNGSWFILGNLLCVLHNTYTVGDNGKAPFRAVEFIKANGKRASFGFTRYSSSVFLRCLKETGMLKPVSYKYISRAIQVHPVVRVKKIKTKDGITMYALFINGVFWQYCTSDGRMHYHNDSLECAMRNFAFLDFNKKKKILRRPTH
ncbi:hypothetical protein [uncultured Pseudoalteromonas sp.]|uniref:hypothetical protein n=1 Tax=uncultured Pseudoalteromonas sp. TaxID=114053 RepID=UPI002593AD3C|nr:hypothetical protein [uncultured Pseudoalteromonas sp.]